MRIRRGIGRPRSTHPSWISRAKQRAKADRGVAILEAAFVTPVFFVLVLGIMEMGLVMNDYLALASSVRAGARSASASGADAYADFNTVQAVLRESAAIDRSDIQYIVIYKATTFGEEPPGACLGGTSQSGTIKCNVYRAADWNRPKSKWGCSDPAISPDRFWCPTTRKVSLSGTGSEFVGVWMKTEHAWVTKMFGNVKTLTDGSVIRLEPRLK